MDQALTINAIWVVGFLVVLLICWTLNLFSAPGNWLIVLAAAVYAYFGPDAGRLDVRWYTVVALLVLAIIGELIEFMAGALGAKRVGGSKRGAVLALIGSVIGAIIGVFVGVPVPVIGQLVAALFFASVGALCGALLGEQWKGKELEEAWRVGKAAFVGRLLGTLGKFMFGAIMLGVAAGSLLF